MTLFLNLRASSVGGILASDVKLCRDADPTPLNPVVLENAARGRDVLLVAHGFNVPQADGINRLSWWEQRLQPSASALFVGILWPGDSSWIRAIDYPLEGNEAIGSGKMLAPYIDRHLASAVSVSFASHSLGARVVLETIKQVQRPVRDLVMMAGAIDSTCLADEYRQAAAKVTGEISLLASEGDHVLKYAFPAGNFLAGIVTRGSPYWHAALGLDGPETPYPATLQGPWEIPIGWAYDHGDYFGNAAPVGPQIAPPVDVPPPPPPPPPIPAVPPAPVNWKPAWSAAFAATRLRR